jgi:hypothetical protein
VHLVGCKGNWTKMHGIHGIMNFYFSPLSSCVLRQTDTFLAYYRRFKIVNKKKTRKESNRLSNSMEQSPFWESNRSSAIRENSRIYAWVFQVVSFRLVSSLKSCMQISSPPFVLHTPPISVFLIWSPEWYLVRSTEHEAPCYVVFSTLLLPHPSWAQIFFFSTLFSKTLSLHSSLNVSDQVSHSYKTTGKIIVL